MINLNAVFRQIKYLIIPSNSKSTFSLSNRVNSFLINWHYAFSYSHFVSMEVAIFRIPKIDKRELFYHIARFLMLQFFSCRGNVFSNSHWKVLIFILSYYKVIGCLKIFMSSYVIFFP